LKRRRKLANIHPRRNYKDIPLWASVSEADWNDWHWQLENRITSVDKLRLVVELTTAEEQGITDSLGTLRMAITPYYATLMDPKDRDCPIRKRAIPSSEELEFSEEDISAPCTAVTVLADGTRAKTIGPGQKRKLMSVSATLRRPHRFAMSCYRVETLLPSPLIGWRTSSAGYMKFHTSKLFV
jgi:hypothetical protein